MIPTLLSANRKRNRGTPTRLSGILAFRDVGGGGLVYTTTGGSTLSTNNTAAARIVDKVNQSINALASSSAPTYKVGANSKAYIELAAGSRNRYDDVDLNPVFSFHCLAPTSNGASQFLYSCQPPSTGTSRFSFIWFDFSAAGGLTADQAATGVAVTSGAWITVFIARNGTQTLTYINNSLVQTRVVNRAYTSPLQEFNEAGFTTFNGKVSAWGYCSQIPGSSDRQLLHDYLTANIPT